MPARGGGKRGDRLTEAVCILFLLFAVFLLVTNILPTRRDLSALQRERRRVDGEIEALREQHTRMTLRGDALQSDPYAIERELREQQSLTRPNEKVLRKGR